LTERVLGLPWVADGIEPELDTESWDLANFASLAEVDPALFEDVLGLPWAVDGLTRPERAVVFGLLNAADDGLGGFARRLLDLAWVADGIETEEDEFALRPFIYTAREDVALARRMADYAWVADDLTLDEGRALGHRRRRCNCAKW